MRFVTSTHQGQDRVGLIEGDSVFGLDPGVHLVDLIVTAQRR